MENNVERPRRKRRFSSRKKRTLDPNLVIDYKYPEVLKRFITDRGKIIPRRISGATAKQQRQIAVAVKRARFLGLIHSSVSHRHEKGFTGEMAAATVMLAGRDFGARRYEGGGGGRDGGRDGGGGRDRDGGGRDGGGRFDQRPSGDAPGRAGGEEE